MKNLKKLLSIILMVSMSAALLAGCGDKKEKSPEPNDTKVEKEAEESAEEIEAKRKQLYDKTEEEYLADVEGVEITEELVLDFLRENIKYFELHESEDAIRYPAGLFQAKSTLEDEGKYTLGNTVDFNGPLFEEFKDSENEIERMYSYICTRTIPSDQVAQFYLDKAETETSIPVRCKNLTLLTEYAGNTDPEKVMTIYENAAKDESPKVRAASSNLGLLAARNPKYTDRGIKIILDLLQDEDANVRAKAAVFADSFGTVESFIDVMEATLMDREFYEAHADTAEYIHQCMTDYPTYENANEKAYNIYVEYLKTEPRDDKVPNWIAVSPIGLMDRDNTLTFMLKQSFFNQTEITNLFIAIAKDENTEFITRNGAFKSAILYGTDEQLGELKAYVEGLEEGVQKNAFMDIIEQNKDFF